MAAPFLFFATQMSSHGTPVGLSETVSTVYVAADSITALSYFAIATALIVIVFRLRDQLPFQLVFVLFGAFIVLCGATHVMGVLPLGNQRGTIEVTAMVATAAVSLLTALILPPLVPRVEALVRDAKSAREREREEARADALAESNELLVAQAAQLKTANEQLAGSLRERERLESHLRQVQKMELMGRLASGVAHDFNNLLAVIQGNIELARDTLSETSVDASFIDEIELATGHASSMTRRLLAFSRKAPSIAERTSLDELLHNERRLLQRALPSDMQLEMRIGQADGLVEVDPNQMQQAILNLIVNARDATASAGVSAGIVTIRTGRVEVAQPALPTSPPIGPGTYMTVSVRDEGTGMSDEVRAQIFEPFFTTKEAGKGTGLGLAMIYDVMAQSGGGVHVDSQLGRGTTFTLMLPRVA